MVTEVGQSSVVFVTVLYTEDALLTHRDVEAEAYTDICGLSRACIPGVPKTN